MSGSEAWMGSDDGPPEEGSEQWRVLQLLPADGWWACSVEESAGQRWHVAFRIVAWALIEVLDEHCEPYQVITGLSSWRTPYSLEDPNTSYRHRDDIPEHARPGGLLGGLVWPVEPLPPLRPAS